MNVKGLAAATALLLVNCSCKITIEPIPVPEVKPHTTARYHHAKTKPLPKPTVAPTVEVTQEWIEKYKKMEIEHNYHIPQDEKITATSGGKVKVPVEVLHHYEDMIKAGPPPTITPTP